MNQHPWHQFQAAIHALQRDYLAGIFPAQAVDRGERWPRAVLSRWVKDTRIRQFFEPRRVADLRQEVLKMVRASEEHEQLSTDASRFRLAAGSEDSSTYRDPAKGRADGVSRCNDPKGRRRARSWLRHGAPSRASPEAPGYFPIGSVPALSGTVPVRFTMMAISRADGPHLARGSVRVHRSH